jgi:cell wall-associated NlpC family hydrolase
MNKLLPALLVLLCSACGTTQQIAPAPAPSPPPHSTTAPAPASDALNDLVMYAMSLADTPYRYGGSSVETGFDCSGFVRHVFMKSLGISLPRTSQEMGRTGEPVSDANLLPGDLVFFNTQRQPYSHVGIYVGESRFVHAPKAGKAISTADMRESYWRKRYDGARRIRVRNVN